MGGAPCKAKENQKPVTIVILGLDNAASDDSVVPTVGFAKTEITHKNVKVNFFDLGGAKGFRNAWRHYFADAHAFVYVIDASESKRLEENQLQLEKLLQDDKVKGKPMLILANKQDKKNALSKDQIIENLDLQELLNGQKNRYRVEVCTAKVSQSTRGKKRDESLANGFEWLLKTIDEHYDEINKRVESDRKKRDASEERNKQAEDRVRKTRKDRDKENDDELDETDEYDRKRQPFVPISEAVKNAENTSRKRLPPLSKSNDSVNHMRSTSHTRFDERLNTEEDGSSRHHSMNTLTKRWPNSNLETDTYRKNGGENESSDHVSGNESSLKSSKKKKFTGKKLQPSTENLSSSRSPAETRPFRSALQEFDGAGTIPKTAIHAGDTPRPTFSSWSTKNADISKKLPPIMSDNEDNDLLHSRPYANTRTNNTNDFRNSSSYSPVNKNTFDDNYSRFNNKSPLAYDTKKPSASSITSPLGTKTNWRTESSTKRPNTASNNRLNQDSDNDENKQETYTKSKISSYSTFEPNKKRFGTVDDDDEFGIQKKTTYSSNTSIKKPAVKSSLDMSDDDIIDRNKYGTSVKSYKKGSDDEELGIQKKTPYSSNTSVKKPPVKSSHDMSDDDIMDRNKYGSSVKSYKKGSDDEELGTQKKSTYSSNTSIKKPPVKSSLDMSDDDIMDRNKYGSSVKSYKKGSDDEELGIQKKTPYSSNTSIKKPPVKSSHDMSDDDIIDRSKYGSSVKSYKKGSDDEELGIQKKTPYSSNTSIKKPPVKSSYDMSNDDFTNKYLGSAKSHKKASDDDDDIQSKSYPTNTHNDNKKYTSPISNYNQSYNSSNSNKNNNSQSRLLPLSSPSTNSALRKSHSSDDEGDSRFRTKQNKSDSDNDDKFGSAARYGNTSSQPRSVGGSDRNNTSSRSRYDDTPSRYPRNSDSFHSHSRPNADTENDLR
ncbi:unnamed protein product [Didymodactylos carnosus]|uniref:ADP-ribosylation factor-like protein 13B n=1 Tax=Didymodactylos carnosus TaxID=1234261 RepID=A0A8S2GLW8_9BILA|nr:unnamed protein product [Didymodactylos carnosus]CAF3533379.1 unnamed protein product [Didymodactylos carnosus]